VSGFSLDDLASLITRRRSESGSGSYTRSLLDGGPALAARKLGEEAVETIIAALSGDKKALKLEAADLLYHLLVVLEGGGVGLADVMAELERRTAQSGLDEKAARRREG
jgi:phosphoribosyl-ATP pyrophosphohydrolase